MSGKWGRGKICTNQSLDTTNSSHLPPAIRRCCKKITDAAIVAVANNCPNLASLNIQYVV